MEISSEHYAYTAKYIITLSLISQNMSLSLDRQRYSISSRSQLNEQLSRLLCYLLSNVHTNEVRRAVLRQIWTMDDSTYVLNFVLTSTLKKTVYLYDVTLLSISILQNWILLM